MDSEWVREDPAATAAERFIRSFWLYTEMTSDIRETITRFVNERSENAIFREETKRRLGFITWEA